MHRERERFIYLFIYNLCIYMRTHGFHQLEIGFQPARAGFRAMVDDDFDVICGNGELDPRIRGENHGSSSR